jgi:hypothetical protein
MAHWEATREAHMALFPQLWSYHLSDSSGIEYA